MILIKRTQKVWLLGIAMLMNLSLALSNPMQQWETWILEDHPQHNCPWVMANGSNKACIWPSRLDLSANDKGATFTYSIDVYEKKAFIALPGNSDHWPLEVIVNGAPAPIIERNSRPHLAIPSGHYKISGRFSWDKRPSQLTVPGDVAIISLVIDGKSQIVDRRNGQLIFSNASENRQKKANDSLHLEVFRLLNDGVPVTMNTHITLSVSGKAREVIFGRVLLDNSEVLHIQSPIPARVEADGTIRAQVLPGEYTLEVFSRFIKSPHSITTQKLTKEWPELEYMSFKSATTVRQVKLTGLVSIDTAQLSIPSEWAQYPTYRISENEVLNIETEFRGDHSPSANELYVMRDLWLDFSGKGITTLDRISGQMNKDWRLNTAMGTHLGRATVGGDPVLITQDGHLEGIEVRSPSIELEAVTRTESKSSFSASGWDAQADRYSATLHLPPGWRVLHATGVDQIWGTWLSQWDLWDIFLVLIIISATRKLIGTAAATIAGSAFLVALHEPGAPLFIIPLLLVLIALLPVVSGKIKSMLVSLGTVLAVALVLLVITFAVSTFRLAIYPSLEHTKIGTYPQSHYEPYFSLARSAPLAQPEDKSIKRQRSQVAEMHLDEAMVASVQKQAPNLYQVTENDRIQTGPGLPTWTWNSVGFKSNGPISAEQTLSIYYSTPWLTSVWRVISVFLIALYAWIVIMRFARLSPLKKINHRDTTGAATTLSIGLILLLGMQSSPDAIAADYPPKYLLDNLEQRLTQAPKCLPNCVSLNDGRIAINGSDITIQFKAYADADLALPLPYGHGSWSLKSVSEYDQVLPLRKQQDNVFVHLSKGHHHIEVKGKIIDDQATVSLPLAIHNMNVTAPGWIVEGLVDGRARNGTLTLRAETKHTAQKTDTLKADPVPAFVRVKRHFIFGKKWSIETTVQRVAPQQGAISLPVKLIPNEKLLKDMGAINSGTVIIQLDHHQESLSWTSSIEPAEKLRLQASEDNAYIEEWSFTPSSLWRLTYDGLPSVKPSPDANAFEPVFKPWPAETLTVNITKPGGVPGDTHTVENALLKVDAGSQFQRATLDMEIRSSLGTDYIVTLPENTEVLKLSVNGITMNTPSENKITVPLQPGSQSITIDFQSLTRMSILSRSPEVRLPDSAANVRVQYSLPRDRWPLYINGPLIGPAMLYWGVLCVILLSALALPQLAKALGFQMPITLTGWLLLGVGLSTVNSYSILVITAMFFILAARKQWIKPETMTPTQFNTMQCLIIGWVGLAVLCMVASIPMGLLSTPEMKVSGNGSASHFYNYYQDIAGKPEGNFPIVTVISVPILAYRIVMLLWSLWLSTQLIRWSIWAWDCLTEKKLWASKPVADTGDA